MIELVFLACLRADPDTCGERVVKFMPGANPAMCMTVAQPELAAWAGNHPDQAIAHWQCRDASDTLSAGNDPGPLPEIR